MQAPTWINGFVAWRWMPSVALVFGSLAFVAVAILIVPDDLGASAAGIKERSRATRTRLADGTSPSLEVTTVGSDGEQPAPLTRGLSAPVRAGRDVVNGIFHPTPPIELPVAPPDPNPEPPPQQPVPPPTATIFTLPEPPPTPQPAPVPNVPPPVPAQPAP